MTRAGQRPENHDHSEPYTRSQDVAKLSSTGIHEGVGEQKCRLQRRELLVRKWDIPPNRTHGNRKSLAIKIADRNRHTYQNGNFPPHQESDLRFSWSLTGESALPLTTIPWSRLEQRNPH